MEANPHPAADPRAGSDADQNGRRDAQGGNALPLAVVDAPRPPGRPSTYTREMGERVCLALEAGTSLRGLRLLDWPPETGTLYDWAEKHPEFGQRFARARKVMAALYAEDVVALPDAVDTDSPFGSARVAKAREQSGARRWLAGCLDRATYGDAVKVESTVAATLTIELSALLPTQTLRTDALVLPNLTRQDVNPVLPA